MKTNETIKRKRGRPRKNRNELSVINKNAAFNAQLFMNNPTGSLDLVETRGRKKGTTIQKESRTKYQVEELKVELERMRYVVLALASKFGMEDEARRILRLE